MGGEDEERRGRNAVSAPDGIHKHEKLLPQKVEHLNTFILLLLDDRLKKKNKKRRSCL